MKKTIPGVQDHRLSWKALGILTYLLSLPDRSNVELSCRNAARPDGRHSTESGLKELKDLGYIKKTCIQDQTGRIVRWETEVFASPQNVENPDSGIS